MWYKFCWHLARLLVRLTHRGIRVEGLENVPEGRAVLCPNHSAALDPVFVGVALSARQRCYFLSKQELFSIPVLGGLIRSVGGIPVHRGTADLGALRAGAEVLRQEKLLLVFPEGTRTVDGKSLKTGEPVTAKAGCALMASMVGAPLVPVYIHNARHKKRPVTVTFCPPVQDFSKKECNQAVEQVMARIDDVRREKEKKA